MGGRAEAAPPAADAAIEAPAAAPPPPRAHDSLRAFMSGAAAGVVTSSLLQPFDVVKTRLQAQAAAGGMSRNMLQVGRAIARTEGVRALWAGVGPACLRVGGGAGLYFLCLSNAQKALATRWPRDADGEPALPALRTFALGAFSRATAAVVFCPVTVVKTRMEYAAVSGVRYRGTLHALATIARAERVRGLFSGLAPTLLRDAPYSGLYLVMFTHMRHAMGADAEHPGLSFLASVLAGGVATVVTHPPDVVRTRAQLLHTMGGGAAAARAAAPAAGMRAIARTEGLAALWSGVTPRIARRTLQQGITWTLFEFLFGARLV